MYKMADELSHCRSEIDAVDDAMIDLLVKRFQVVNRVVAHKTAHGLPALIQSRVDEVVARVTARASQKGLPVGLVERLWRDIISGTIAYERRNKVA
jgi:isochorismate pyruvate lyase